MGTVPFFRRGFTLIEMLVVVTIMMLLVAIAATRMQPDKDRRVREAARAITVYLSSARNRAMETGRPAGVMLRRLSAALPCAMTIDQCEVAPCYCGDTEQSYAGVTLNGSTLTATLSDGAPTNLVRRCDQIQFNSQGPVYTIVSTDPVDGNQYLSTDTLTLTNDPSGGPPTWTQPMPWSTTLQNVPYRIYRTPIKSAATPLQLQAATVIDLDASGIDGGGALFNAGGDTMILFSPTGAIDRVFINGQLNYVTQTIFLLVGKRERVGTAFTVNPAANDTAMTNYQDLGNSWVTINPQTGLINTDYVAASSRALEAEVRDDSRSLAREGQGKGGR